jgi:hypothetical protein
LFSRLEPSQVALRAPASLDNLAEVENRIGRRLPSAYRSFLQSADGGTLGDHRIYGSIELLGLLDACQEPSELARVPFHPLRFGVECLDLSTGSVHWARYVAHELANADVHEVARKVVRGGARPDRHGLSFEQTYEDFMDWGLDVLYGLHYPLGDFAAHM